MALQVRHMSPVTALRDGLAAFSRSRAADDGLWTALNKAEDARRVAFGRGFTQYTADLASADPARAARLWQGGDGYYGVDALVNTPLRAGDRIVVSLPGPSGWAVPEASAMSLRGGAETVPSNRYHVQVEPRTDYPPNVYRNKMAVLEARHDTTWAIGTANENPQFGAGGLPQGFAHSIDADLIANDINDHFVVVSRSGMDNTLMSNVSVDVRTAAEAVGLRRAVRAPLRAVVYVETPGNTDEARA